MVSNVVNSYNANATKSPLLRLPPEVRNRIWTFLLGERSIHVHSSMLKGRPIVLHRVCAAEVSDDETARMIKEHNKGDDAPEWFATFDVRHQHCSFWSYNAQARGSGLSLRALAVCRQIHQEAALLPYQRNTFSFDSLNSVAPFLQSLYSAQAHAIESISLAGSGGRITRTLQGLIRTKLKGLRSLTWFIELVNHRGVHNGMVSNFQYNNSRSY